jgi:multimeric flavodoxin WrbA
VNLDYKECRECYACQLKVTKDGQCLFCDRAYDLLRGIKSLDGLVFAAPVYYFDVSSQMKTILERLFYSERSEQEISITMINTMDSYMEKAKKEINNSVIMQAYVLLKK